MQCQHVDAMPSIGAVEMFEPLIFKKFLLTTSSNMVPNLCIPPVWTSRLMSSPCSTREDQEVTHDCHSDEHTAASAQRCHSITVAGAYAKQDFHMHRRAWALKLSPRIASFQCRLFSPVLFENRVAVLLCQGSAEFRSFRHQQSSLRFGLFHGIT